MIEVKITGADAVEKAVRQLAQQVPQRVANALRAEAEEVMANSKDNYVPVDRGHLKGSGVVMPPVIHGTVFGKKDIYCTMGYGGPAAPYALAVHENPRSGKTGGFSPSGRRYKHWARKGEWKYLERPFLLRVPGLGARVKARVLGNL